MSNLYNILSLTKDTQPKFLILSNLRWITNVSFYFRFYANANDTGTYSCTAENKAGKDRVETNLIVLGNVLIYYIADPHPF